MKSLKKQYIGVSLPSWNEIEERALKHKGIKSTINPDGLKFRMYGEFLNGAKWLYNLLTANEK